MNLEQYFPKADRGRLRLMKRMLAFDPAERPTSEEALADPYFAGLSQPGREPSAQPVSKLSFDFERKKLTTDEAWLLHPSTRDPLLLRPVAHLCCCLSAQAYPWPCEVKRVVCTSDESLLRAGAGAHLQGDPRVSPTHAGRVSGRKQAAGQFHVSLSSGQLQAPICTPRRRWRRRQSRAPESWSGEAQHSLSSCATEGLACGIYAVHQIAVHDGEHGTCAR